MKGKLLTTVCALGFATSAFAQDYAVGFKAEELNSFQGVKSVHAQIEQVAKDHCPSYREIRSLADVRSCRAEVVADLVNKVDNPNLTAFHSGEAVEQIAQR